MGAGRGEGFVQQNFRQRARRQNIFQRHTFARARTDQQHFCEIFCRINFAVADRFKNDDAKTVFAPAQARRARVPFVVVVTMVLPRTFSGVYSRGELPRSKSMPSAEI